MRPRPPTLTSIPSLLSVFQNEWDALALETYTLKQQLVQTRQELSTALYQHDAAVRVIARLSRERDEARDALSKTTLNGGPVSNGDSMQVDSQELSEALAAKVDATQERWGISFSGSLSLLLTQHNSDCPKHEEKELFQKIGQMQILFSHLNPKRYRDRYTQDHGYWLWTKVETWRFLVALMA